MLDQCNFGIDCFYSHIPIPEGYYRCFQCGEEFESLNHMMLHRKGNHDSVKICKKFVENKCTKGPECWWLHENEVLMKSPQKSQAQGFQKTGWNPFPPLGKSIVQSVATSTPETHALMKHMIETMAKFMKVLQDQQ